MKTAPMFVLTMLLVTACALAEPIPPITRRVPPPGIDISADQVQKMQAGLAELGARLSQLKNDRVAPDVRIFHKAVEYALLHNEFYRKNDTQKVDWALATAHERLDQLRAGKAPWLDRRGTVVRGFVSAIDGSVQLYGLTIPENLDPRRPTPLYIWLHGRGDTQTDLHFMHRLGTRGTASPFKDVNAIVLEPFGRQCIGWKSAGETDVFEAIDQVRRQFRIDEDRIVLAGYSMGGAGAWHIGAHYTENFAAIQAGAGFVDLRRYQNITPENYPPAYEMALWNVYDVPEYVFNLFNKPVIAYNGEIDKQRASGEIMAELYRQHGRELPHILGPGLAHKAPSGDALKQVMALVNEAVRKGNDRYPQQLYLQTRTLRYNRMHWVEILGLQKHWENTLVDAKQVGNNRIDLTTTNVAYLKLTPPRKNMNRFPPRFTVNLNGRELKVAAPTDAIVIDAVAGRIIDVAAIPAGRKRPGLQGPIDDAFLEPFLVVRPTGRSSHERVQRWVDFELAHFVDRWRALFRGELRIKDDVDVTDADRSAYHLVLWGTPESNRLIAKVADQLPIRWSQDAATLGDSQYDASSHVPLLIHPNPLHLNRYVVLNSGPTFREAHDRTNSLQNPKLGDWAIVDLSQPPNDTTPGRIADAGFFGENWELKAK